MTGVRTTELATRSEHDAIWTLVTTTSVYSSVSNGELCQRLARA